MTNDLVSLILEQGYVEPPVCRKGELEVKRYV